MSVYDNVIRSLAAWDATYDIVEHDDVFTCDVMAGYCECPESQILKSVVLKDKDGKLWVYVLPGDERVDSKRVRKALNVKNISFAKIELAEETCGCAVGSIPPFGHMGTVSVAINNAIFQHEFGYFSPGRHDRSIKIKTDILRKIEDVRIIDLDSEEN